MRTPPTAMHCSIRTPLAPPPKEGTRGMHSLSSRSLHACVLAPAPWRGSKHHAHPVSTTSHPRRRALQLPGPEPQCSVPSDPPSAPSHIGTRKPAHSRHPEDVGLRPPAQFRMPYIGLQRRSLPHRSLPWSRRARSGRPRVKASSMTTVTTLAPPSYPASATIYAYLPSHGLDDAPAYHHDALFQSIAKGLLMHIFMARSA